MFDAIRAIGIGIGIIRARPRSPSPRSKSILDGSPGRKARGRVGEKQAGAVV
jgi:hypothetical protein